MKPIMIVSSAAISPSKIQFHGESMTNSLQIGIAITTYNRKSMVLKHVRDIKRLTSLPLHLVVCDDGSSDGTVDALRAEGVITIGSSNKGIAWNKNRGLFYLLSYTQCDVILLLDDDVRPRVFGWEREWVEAALQYGHMNYATNQVRKSLIHGSCDASDPGVARAVSGQCIAFRRDVLSLVGYMDPRFGTYGHEHTELTLRCIRLGFGGFFLVENEKRSAVFYVIEGGVKTEPAVSHADEDSLVKNSEIFSRIQREGIYRAPWTDEDSYLALRDEMAETLSASGRPTAYEAVVFKETAYNEANPDVATSSFSALDHYLTRGRLEKRRLRRV